MKWEYKILTFKRVLLHSELDAAGAEGWDLVSILPTIEGFQVVFKRPVA